MAETMVETLRRIRDEIGDRYKDDPAGYFDHLRGVRETDLWRELVARSATTSSQR